MKYKKEIFNILPPIFIFLFLLILYFYTMAPTISWWDCPEFVTAAFSWGIPHPPGNPIFVTIAKIFTMFFKTPELIARSVNFLSVLSTTIAAVFFYFSLKEIFKIDNIYKTIILTSSIICGFLSFSVWDSAVEAEVYGLTILFISIEIFLAVKILKGKSNLLPLLFYILFLSISVHLLSFLMIIPILICFLIFYKKINFKFKYIPIILFFILIALSSVLIMYFRAQQLPELNESGIKNFNDFFEVLLRKQYEQNNIFQRQTGILTNYNFFKSFYFQIAAYFNYLSWQYFHFIRMGVGGILGSTVSVFYLILIFTASIFSIIKSAKKKNFYLIVFFLSVFITFSFFLVFILNFKFCPSDPIESHIPKEVRPRDYFFLISYPMIVFLSFSALYFIKRKIFSLVLIPIFILNMYNGLTGHTNRRGNFAAFAFAENILNTVSDKSIILVHGDNDTFPLWYAQIVGKINIFNKGSEKGTIVINLTLLNLPWYMDEISEKIPFQLSKIYSDFLIDSWDSNESDFESFCRKNARHISREDYSINNNSTLTVGDVVIRCVLCEAFNIDYDIYTVILNDKKFIELLNNHSTDFEIYSTVKDSFLNTYLIKEGLLYHWKGDSLKNIDILRNYDFRSIIASKYLDEKGRIIDLNNIEISDVLKRDLDTRGMSNFYFESIEIASKYDNSFDKLKELFEDL